jgi:hypothetical protein
MANVNSVQHTAKVEQSGHIIWATYEIATIASAADTITMFTLPAGTTVHSGLLYGDVIDAHATPTLEMDVGIVGNADLFLNSGTVDGDAVGDINPEAGIRMALAGELKDGPITVTTATDVFITYTAAAATTGTGTINLMMDVTCFDARVSPPDAPQ